MGSNSRGKFVFCLVIVFIFIGLGRAYRLEGGGGEDFEVVKSGSSLKGMGPFLWRKLTPQDTM